MTDSFFAAQLDRALDMRLAQPVEERRADLIRRGVMDAAGNLLLVPPSGPTGAKAKASTVAKGKMATKDKATAKAGPRTPSKAPAKG